MLTSSLTGESSKIRRMFFCFCRQSQVQHKSQVDGFRICTVSKDNFCFREAKMSNLYKYANLIKLQTPYAKRMQFLSNRIFGEVGKIFKDFLFE
jgi:hypothetical protein